jgi:hypothetical protein
MVNNCVSRVLNTKFKQFYLHEPAALFDHVVESEEVKSVFRNSGTSVDGRIPFLHELKQFVQPGSSLGVFIHFVQLPKAVRFLQTTSLTESLVRR